MQKEIGTECEEISTECDEISFSKLSDKVVGSVRKSISTDNRHSVEKIQVKKSEIVLPKF